MSEPCLIRTALGVLESRRLSLDTAVRLGNGRFEAAWRASSDGFTMLEVLARVDPCLAVAAVVDYVRGVVGPDGDPECLDLLTETAGSMARPVLIRRAVAPLLEAQLTEALARHVDRFGRTSDPVDAAGWLAAVATRDLVTALTADDRVALAARLWSAAAHAFVARKMLAPPGEADELPSSVAASVRRVAPGVSLSEVASACDQRPSVP
jgi:hypothetical protein